MYVAQVVEKHVVTCMNPANFFVTTIEDKFFTNKMCVHNLTRDILYATT